MAKASAEKKQLSDEINTSLNWDVDWTKLSVKDLAFVHAHLTDMAKLAGSRVGVLAEGVANQIRNRAFEMVGQVMSGKQANPRDR